MAPDEPDPLNDLREQIRATQEAAERLAGAQRVPPQGWAVPPRPGDDARHDDLAALVAVLGSLRELVPPELQAQLTDLIRQVLVLVRALIDRWLELLEQDAAGRPGRDGPDVEDIPIG